MRVMPKLPSLKKQFFVELNAWLLVNENLRLNIPDVIRQPQLARKNFIEFRIQEIWHGIQINR